MAFASIRSGATTAFSSGSTSWAVNMPPTVEPGDQILVIIQPWSASTPPTGSRTGWTSRQNDSMFSDRTLQFLTKDAVTGSEDGTTETFTISSSSLGTAIALAIHAADDPANWAFGTIVTTTGTANPDPPSLTSGFGAVDTLWLAVAAGFDDDATVSAYPTNYSHYQNYVVSGGGTNNGNELGVGARQYNAASDNPGQFTLSESENWGAQTVAIAYGTPSGSAALTAAMSVSATGKKHAYGAAALSAAVAVSATGTKHAYGAAALAAAVTVSATGTKKAYGAAALTAALTVSASGRKQRDAAVSMAMSVSATGYGRTRGVVFVAQGEAALLGGTWDKTVASTARLYSGDPSKGISAAAINALTESDFTEATFTGYSGQALTSGNWTVTPGTPTEVAHATVTWTATAAPGSPLSFLGYYVTRNSDGALIYFETWTDGPKWVADNGDSIAVDPTWTLGVAS